MYTKNSIFTMVMATVMMLSASPAAAHFGTITPSDDIVTVEDSKTVNLQVKFIHPCEGDYLEMARPKRFGVLYNGKKTDLTATLQTAKGKGPGQSQKYTFWAADFQVRRPGDYTFYVQPTPYWEPAEDLFIVHYTKVCVNAMGREEGWDHSVGLETEIIPFTRPYGLWTGNLFTGQVLLKGKPVPFAKVEVEYLNEALGNRHRVSPPADPYVTQVVKTDGNGMFSYAIPKAGWWGFSALNEADWKLEHKGQEKSVEIGAVYWVHTHDIK